MTVKDKEAIAAWWAEHPQTYGTDHGGTTFEEADGLRTLELGSREFFERADREFFSWNTPLHDDTGPFGRIFPYARYAGREVLEIGCGMGCMSSLWAARGARMTAVDLNPVAIAQTTRRFELFGLSGRIQREDANRLSFADGAFNYAYSFGVLHHSPDLPRSIAEMMRVLAPGGEFGLMLYNRHSLLQWYRIEYLEGLVHGENRFLDRLALSSRYTDGDGGEGNPHTWPVTAAEIREMLDPHAEKIDTRVLGTDIDGILSMMLLPGVSRMLPRFVRKSWARRWGWSLWIEGRKKG